MCLGGGGGSPKVEQPKPSPLPPPLPAPPPPPKPAPAPKKLQEDTPVDIRIGAAKTSSTARSTRSTDRESRGAKSLTIGNNQGLKI